MGLEHLNLILLALIKSTFYVNLDHTKRMETYGKDVLKKYEKTVLVFGTNETMTSYLVMDKNSSIYYR